MINKFLFTTFGENKTGKNHFFLNHWLIKNQFFRKKDNGNLIYHWDSLVKKKRDYKHLSKFYEKVLKDLSKKLNQIHNVNYNLLYWRVILGPWLYTYITSNYDRWEILSRILKNKNFFLKYYSYNTEEFVNLNYKDYINKLTTSDNYNYKKFDRILKFRSKKNLNIITKHEFIRVNSIQPIFSQKLDHLIFIFQKIYFNFNINRNKNIFFMSFFKKKNIFSFITKFGKKCNRVNYLI